VPGLEKILRQAGHLVQPNAPEAKAEAPAPTPAEAVAFGAQRRKKAKASAASDSAGTDDARDPAPVAVPSHLVTRLRVTEKGKGQHMLQITDGVTSLSIPLNDEELAQFSHGIVTVLKNADWDVAPNIGVVDDTTSESAGTGIDITADSPSKYRH
jgi:hypothetical protein